MGKDLEREKQKLDIVKYKYHIGEQLNTGHSATQKLSEILLWNFEQHGKLITTHRALRTDSP